MYSPPRVSSSGLVVFAILHHVATFLYLGASVAMVFMNHSDDQLLCSLLAALFWIPMVTFDSLILHRGWSAVQDGQADVTPGNAVGLGFIPFFGLYWNFVAHYGLMRQFNRQAEGRGRPDQKVTEGLALTYAILMATICLEPLGRIFRIVTIWQTIGAVKDGENA
ncbi:MAG: hypothetical protein RL444_509 [Verrucomicrobiota bacterium]|jgi:hypothetical protein